MVGSKHISRLQGDADNVQSIGHWLACQRYVARHKLTWGCFSIWLQRRLRPQSVLFRLVSNSMAGVNSKAASKASQLPAPLPIGLVGRVIVAATSKSRGCSPGTPGSRVTSSAPSYAPAPSSAPAPSPPAAPSGLNRWNRVRAGGVASVSSQASGSSATPSTTPTPSVGEIPPPPRAASTLVKAMSSASTDRQEIGKGNLVACGEIGCDVEGRWKAMFSKKVYEDDRPDAVFSWRYTCIGCYAAIHNMTEQEALMLYAPLVLVLLTLVWWFLPFPSLLLTFLCLFLLLSPLLSLSIARRQRSASARGAHPLMPASEQPSTRPP